MIRIYNFPAPTRAVRPIWLCEEMGLAYEVEAIAFPSGADYRARYPIGSVPYLEDGDSAMGESIAMLLYLAEKYGPTPLLPAPGDPVRSRVIEFCLFSEATFGAAMNPQLATKFFAPEDQKANWLTSYMQTRCHAMVAYLAGKFGQGPYLAGERFTIADIAVCGSLGMWTGGLGKTLPERLAAYQARLAARPAQQRAMERVAGTKAPSSPAVIPGERSA
jgi:glutathione S-transferase